MIRAVEFAEAETGRVIRAFLAGGSTPVVRVTVDAFFLSLLLASETLDAFEIESKIL